MTPVESSVKAISYTKLFKRKHYNKWVALNKEKSKIVAYGNNPKYVLQKAKKSGVNDPIITIALQSYYGFIT